MTAQRGTEEDFPKGHPARWDFDPASPEAAEWMRKNVAPLGDRDFPVDHPKAADTPGNANYLEVRAGIDPHNPHLEAFTGRTPEQAAGVKRISALASKAAAESPVLQPVDMTVLGAMFDAKRRELHVDVLTPEQHEAVIREYHNTRGQVAEAKAKAAALPLFDQALSYVMSRGYKEEAAREIVTRETPEVILKGAGLA
jgi:hypothetical protein